MTGLVGTSPLTTAMAAGIFAAPACELLDRRTLRSHSEAREAVFGLIEGWYNPHRRESGNDQLSPVGRERKYFQAQGLKVSAGAGWRQVDRYHVYPRRD
jgi:hypothetical protein